MNIGHRQCHGLRLQMITDEANQENGQKILNCFTQAKQKTDFSGCQHDGKTSSTHAMSIFNYSNAFCIFSKEAFTTMQCEVLHNAENFLEAFVPRCPHFGN